MTRPPRKSRRKPPSPLPQDVATAAETKGMTPLEYMLGVMRDPKTSERRRDRMAVVCARYLHAKPAEIVKGKKHQQAEAAATAGVGTPWADIEFDRDWSQ